MNKNEQFLCRCLHCKTSVVVGITRRLSTMAWDCPKCHQTALFWPWLELGASFTGSAGTTEVFATIARPAFRSAG